ncbi:uncharacterized protein ATC70_000283 [Mucor velutinosus]|uniref:Uncharacterized protein n=1 Tax=Mucor velutinosus TaxID=708070 RepID=A0AAN7DJ93_9FUNG|nr:hypothetical protein ATC70_000283 [Mucor velutinosus]
MTADEQQSLIDPITLDELLQQANRSVKATAPGSDGLASPFLSLLFINSVKPQCQIYGQRQLSILDRVTIVNSLILSKVWYSLRMLKPTERFLEKIKSCVYQFVWQKKRPLLRKDLVFLSKSRDGLAVLDPSLQQLILQKRWLNCLVESHNYPFFLLPFLIYHLSLPPIVFRFPIPGFPRC